METPSLTILKVAGIVIVLVVLLTLTSSGQKAAMHLPEVNKPETYSIEKSKVCIVETNTLPTPKKQNMLFFLQRDPDVNTVIYELNFKSDGILDRENPVKGSWIRYTENGVCKELTSIHKKFAYGIKCKPLANDEYEIRLVAYDKLPLYLRRSETDNKYKIYIKDEGHHLLLKRVFVRVNGGSFWFPKVQYIDLITTSSATGIEILKRTNI